MSHPRIVVVANRLPVNIVEEAGKLVLKRSVGGLATALGSVSESQKMLWIGWPGTVQRLSKKQLQNLNFQDFFVPVTFSKRLLVGYYNRIANGILWPLLHGIKPAKLDMKADWQATKHVVNLFADAVVANTAEQDVIWIHDYQLILLPEVLRQRHIKNRLGFFLHTPFPSPAIFMSWKQHKRILASLSRVDVLGFQTQKDVANFKACLKQSGIELRKGQVVKAFPIGIDYRAFQTSRKFPKVTARIPGLGQFNKRGRKLILSVSRLDYTKGIIQQLRAVETALLSGKAGKPIYRLVVAPSRESLDEYKALKQQVADTVTEINTKLQDLLHYQPILYEYRTHDFEELNAWYRLADVLLVTPIIDGMNLVVKEYIAARGPRLGSVVLSRTIGAASQLSSAILVDPSDKDDISRGIIKAINMPLAERAVRWQKQLTNVKEQDIFWWTNSFLSELYNLPVGEPSVAVSSSAATD